MSKNKNLFFSVSIFLLVVIFNFVFVNNVFASPAITSYLLNGSSQNVTFNPNNGESISIEVKANTLVKFTRLYICPINQICNGTSGNYTRYFTQSDVSDTIIKSWNGKKPGDIEIVPAGEYKVMVSMTEGTNSPVTEFGQYSIFVDFSSINSTSTNSNATSTSGNSASATTTPPTSTSNAPVIIKTVYISSHSDPEGLSNYDEKKIFETNAGRERTALVGSPVEFNAKYTLLQKDQCTPDFKWSFGDGFEAVGKDTGHIYKYQGEYQVVLNGNCGDYNSISRTIVRVTAPNVSLSSLENGDIKITNNAKTEINIGLWKIKNELTDFIFPQDTIIAPLHSIVLSSEDTKLYTNASSSISLNNPIDKEVAIINHTEQSLGISSSSQTISSISNNIENNPVMTVEKAEALAKEYKLSLVLQKKNSPIAPIVQASTSSNTESDTLKEEVTMTATVIEAVNSSSTTGFWKRIWGFPLNSIKSIFHSLYSF